MHPHHLPAVAVIGSGVHGDPERCDALGRAIAELGCNLVTGGGQGVMEAVTRAFVDVSPRPGRAIGILPGNDRGEPPAGYPNAFVEIPVRTHLALRGEHGSDQGSRNHIVVLTANAVVAMPGRQGTASEIELALAYGVPICAYVESRNDFPGLPHTVPVHPTVRAVTDFLQPHVSPGVTS